jgi:hypothetical protein
MTTLAERIAQDDLFFDSAVHSHGYAPFMRDYDVVIDRPAAKPDGTGSYIMGRYRYRFTHCPEVRVTTTVSDAVWQKSWADHVIDYDTWERAGEPGGYVWGVCWSNAYPGLSYVADSPLAASWSVRLNRAMREIRIETNAFELQLVCHDLLVQQLAIGNPLTDELSPVLGQ